MFAPGDTIVRLGNDEFGILVDGIRDLTETQRAAEQAAERAAASRPPFWLPDGEALVSAGIGLPIGSGADAEALLKRAGAALCQVQPRTHARYGFFEVDGLSDEDGHPRHGNPAPELEIPVDGPAGRLDRPAPGTVMVAG